MPSPFIFKDKFRSALWGFIVGDALGVPFEFCTREEMQQNAATGIVGYGTHGQPPGTWSDDTSMMLCVMENIFEGKKSANLAKLFVKWYDEGYHTAHGEVFDIGITTREAIENIKAGVHLSEVGSMDDYSAGNGSLMRSVPYAFVEDISQSILRSNFEGFLTHRLSICSTSTFLFIKNLRYLAEGLSKEEALQRAGGYLRHGWRITDVELSEDFVKNFRRLFSKDFHKLPENEIKSGGYVIHSLEAAIWSFMNSSTYEETVLKAVNLGGDTDTIAALSGALAGAYYGIEQIPTHWMEQIARKDELAAQINLWLAE